MALHQGKSNPDFLSRNQVARQALLQNLSKRKIQTYTDQKMDRRSGI